MIFRLSGKTWLQFLLVVLRGNFAPCEIKDANADWENDAENYPDDGPEQDHAQALPEDATEAAALFSEGLRQYLSKRVFFR